ncbi:MAG: hypothetical protein JNL58_09160 [Planctomyces sp.]|nr:hypothetical protein [Planctomyces sp.]
MHIDDGEQISGDQGIGLWGCVDVYDQRELFEDLDSVRVVELSRLGGQTGFSGIESVRKSTGISLRRLMRPGLAAVDLGDALCHALEQKTGRSLGEFSRVFLCHSHTDPQQCHRLANQLTDRLALPENLIQAFNHGCCGFLKLLQDAAMHIEAGDESIALLSVETPETWHDGSDRLFCGLVSAGATAVVVERGRGLPLSVVRADDFQIPRERRPNPDPLFRKDNADVFTFRGEPIHRTVMRMNAEPVFLNGIELMLTNLRAAMASMDLKPGQRVVVLPHQPSAKLLKALVAAAKNEFPGVEFLNNLDQYGNTISSSVPTILCRLPQVLAANGLRPLREGDHLVLLAAGICMEEIADHMTAGHACLTYTAQDLRHAQGLSLNGDLTYDQVESFGAPELFELIVPATAERMQQVT